MISALVVVILILAWILFVVRGIARAVEAIGAGDSVFDAPDAPTAYTHAPQESAVLIDKQIEGEWHLYAPRPADHPDVAEIRAGLHPGLRIRGDQ